MNTVDRAAMRLIATGSPLRLQDAEWFWLWNTTAALGLSRHLRGRA